MSLQIKLLEHKIETILQYFSSEQILNCFKNLISDIEYINWLKNLNNKQDNALNKSLEEIILNKLSAIEIIELINEYNVDIYNKLLKNLKEIINNEY